MWISPVMTQELARDRIKEALREADERRQHPVAKIRRKVWRWWLPSVLSLGSLVALALMVS